MDKQECKDILLARKANVIAKGCISLLESCTFTLKQHFRDKEELEERDKDCISLIRVAQGNLGFFKDSINSKIDLLKSTLSKIYEDEKTNKANLEAAKTKLINSENQKKISENNLSSSKAELEKVNFEVNKKKQVIDGLNKKHSTLLHEKKNFEDQKTGKEAAASKLLSDENNAQNNVNNANNEYNFVRSKHDKSNPCYHDPSPHLYDDCIQQYKNKINEKQGVKDQITAQKNQAVNELNSINSQIQNKINEISTIKSSLSTHQQEFNDLVGRQTLKNNELNSVDSTIIETTQNIANEQNQISKLEANSQASFMTSKEQELQETELYFSSLLGVTNKIYSTEIVGAISQYEQFIQQEEL